jgi:uncharacterized protein with PIN domain
MQFFCDVMLGRLARYLRMLGLDTFYSRSISESGLIKYALEKKLTILTRRTRFLKMKESVPFFFVKSNNPKSQLKEVIKDFNIGIENVKPFSRCLLCNEVLKEVDRHIAEGAVPDYIFNTIDTFSQCPNCLKIYWQGTHYKNMFESLLGLICEQKNSSLIR